MTDKQILEKAIKLANAGGWQMFGFSHFVTDSTSTFVVFNNFNEQTRDFNDDKEIWKQIEAIIYDHDFAKALWPDLTSWYATSNRLEGPHATAIREWQYHLQQLVIAPDPMAYLHDNLPR